MAVIILIATVLLFIKITGYNSYENYQVRQGITGNVDVVDSSGYYFKWFATTADYRRSIQTFYSNNPAENERDDKSDSISVTFNDGGQADVNTMVRFEMPSDQANRLKVHQAFSGNIDLVKSAVRAHLVNCLKNTAPVMSASENQAGRKSEFNSLIEDQLKNGLYQMRVVPKIMKDATDETGQSITIYTTEVIRDAKTQLPIIANPSPLEEYGIRIVQFSITGTEYDAATRDQFAAKKQSFLAAEQSKAQREQEVQQRLMTVEKGLREKAEVEAIANKEKATAEIAAQKNVAVAEQEKLEATVRAKRQVEIATQAKLEAEIKAQQELEVSRLATEAARQRAEAMMILAKAERDRINVGGAISEEKLKLAEIAAERDVRVAEHLARVSMPQIWINGTSGQGNGGDLQSQLLSLGLLKFAGIELKNTIPNTIAAPASR